MSDQNDDTQGYALMVLAGVVVLVIGGVLALAIWSTSGGHGTVRPAAGVPAAATGIAAAPAGEPDGRLYFELDSDALPADAQAVLGRVADAERADPGKVVLISGYHDASGDAAHDAELAKRRAETVRHALEADGVPADKLVLDKPIVSTGGGDPKEARRVEMRVR